MPRKPIPRNVLATYFRSYFVTLGLAIIVPGVFILVSDGAGVAASAWGGIALFATLMAFGIGALLFGLLGPTERMEAWGEVASRHEASIVIMVLAFPAYLLLVPFYGRR